jgi:G:T/U-mismatch repair DNA glycosylase
MKTITHRFSNHRITQSTETLVIGTFNPEVIGNNATFFYGRSRNYMWTLLPTAFNEKDLKKADKNEKLTFIEKRKIDFIDLISEISVDEGQEANYDDIYIDSKVTSWRDVISEIDGLKNLKRVCFTRKTLSGIPNMKKQVETIQGYCTTRRIPFRCIVTPARYYNQDKQAEWTNFLHDNR